MLTEPWIVEPVSMAPRTNTLPQPVEKRSNERTRRGERRRFTNHLAIEVYRQLSAPRVWMRLSICLHHQPSRNLGVVRGHVEIVMALMVEIVNKLVRVSRQLVQELGREP